MHSHGVLPPDLTYYLGDLRALLSFPVLTGFGGKTWAGAPSTVTPVLNLRPPRPAVHALVASHLHARSLLLGQAHRVAAVRTQNRAERAHATATAATEELNRAFDVLRTAPVTRPVGLIGRPRLGSPARHSQWQPPFSLQ